MEDRLEDQRQQADDDQKADQKNDSDGASEELEHWISSSSKYPAMSLGGVTQSTVACRTCSESTGKPITGTAAA